jgi:type II secretory pathway pseudopilin PulG
MVDSSGRGVPGRRHTDRPKADPPTESRIERMANRADTSRQPITARRPGSGRRPNRAATGFTLIETLFALVIIGLGVVVILRSMVVFLYNNTWSTHSATGTYLAAELRELTRSLPRHDRFSGGLYFATPGDPATLQGWGLEGDETEPIDIDDIDDLDGVVFGNATDWPADLGFTMSVRMPGPINAFGDVISETDWDGNVETVEVDGEQIEVAMRGWSQLVQVDKVDPNDYSVVVPDSEFLAGLRDVDEYPLRVTVTLVYDGPWDEQVPPISQMSWVVPE